MNKNLKKVIAIALTVSAFSAVVPGTNFGLITTKAYAASGDLTSIKLKTSDGSTIKTYDDDDYKSKNEIDDNELENEDTYYAKTSSSTIKITTKGVSSSNVRIFKSKSSSAKGIKTSSSIDLSEDSTTTLTIRTYDDDPGTVKYSDDSYTSQYIIKVKCTATSSDNEDENDDDVYLKSLSLSDGEISFLKSTSTYNINVAESVDEVTITAKPDCDSDEYDDYTVKIDGSTVDEDDKFKKTVSLDKGNNEIKITVEEDDDDNKRTYTLNITRGNTNNNNNNNSNNETGTTIKSNQWVLVNGQWQYNDTLGKPVKNMWINNYYLKYDGNMGTGWQYINGDWYYLGYDGTMKKGWQFVNGSWYYLDQQGKMLTGWFKDVNGKYYYLYTNSGAMAYNTIINGYKVGSDGAWIK